MSQFHCIDRRYAVRASTHRAACRRPRVLVEEAPGILLYPALNCVATILTTHSNVYVLYPLVLVSPQYDYERVEVE